MSRHSAALRVLQYVRDKAHRFAQHYHHILRRKKMEELRDFTAENAESKKKEKNADATHVFWNLTLYFSPRLCVLRGEILFPIWGDGMHILLTNDDGVYAPGLRAFLPGAASAGRGGGGGAGHGAQRRRPLGDADQPADRAGDSGRRAPAAGLGGGGPAGQLRQAALRELLPAPPDLIVSGLNAGSNAGINVLYSGTVAAAVEGAFFRVTSIACSLEYSKPTPPDFARGAAYARQVVEQILGHRPGSRLAV